MKEKEGERERENVNKHRFCRMDQVWSRGESGGKEKWMHRAPLKGGRRDRGRKKDK